VLHPDIKTTPAWHKNNYEGFDEIHKTFGTTSVIVISIFVTDYIHYRKAIRSLYKWQPGSSHEFTGKKQQFYRHFYGYFQSSPSPAFTPP